MTVHVSLSTPVTSSLLSGYDEPEILSYQITLFGPISADIRHMEAALQDLIKQAAALGISVKN